MVYISPSYYGEYKILFTFEDKTKAFKEIASLWKVVLALKHPRNAFDHIFGATFVETLEKDCFASFVLFCLLCQGRIVKNLKLTENCISQKVPH